MCSLAHWHISPIETFGQFAPWHQWRMDAVTQSILKFQFEHRNFSGASSRSGGNRRCDQLANIAKRLDFPTELNERIDVCLGQHREGLLATLLLELFVRERVFQ